MTADRDTTRIVRAWLRTDEHESADRVLGVVLARLDTTPQRRRWSAWRYRTMNTNILKLGIAAVAIVAVGLVGLQLVPGNVGGPTPTPATIAKGSFTAPLTQGPPTTIEIDAIRTGTTVAGALRISEGGGAFSVGLTCTLTTPTGLIFVGGAITESTHDAATVGIRAALLIQPGSPAKVALWFEDQPPAADCAAFLATVPDDSSYLQPVTGTLTTGP